MRGHGLASARGSLSTSLRPISGDVLDLDHRYRLAPYLHDRVFPSAWGLAVYEGAKEPFQPAISRFDLDGIGLSAGAQGKRHRYSPMVTLFNAFNYVIAVDDQIADHLSRHEQSHAILSYLSAFSIKELELIGTETTTLRTAQWRCI